MKNLIVFIIMMCGLSFYGQDLELINQTSSPTGHTIVYSAKIDGTLDKNNYLYFDYPTGKIIIYDNKGVLTGNDTVQNIIIRIIANKIYTYGKQGHFTENPPALVSDKTESTLQIGYLTSDKKIISLRKGIPSDEASAPYIKDNKVYDSKNKIIAFIEGQEIYGAASYLLAL